MLARSTIFFPLILAIALAIITFWINLTVEQQGPKIDGSNRHDPDYTMNNFVTTQTDITGQLRYVLAAAEMMHYPDDDSTVLQRPRFTQYTADKPYTQIEGLRAYVSSDGEEVELVDNVKVVRQAFEGKGEMQVLTEKLLILPNKDLVKTDSPVVIKQAPKTVITATGMIFDKKKQTLTLNKRVKAHYERPTGVITKTKPVITKPIAKPLSAVSASSSKKDMVAKPNTATKKKPLKKRKTLKKATRSKK
ncbi:MAG: LPS export ABC transporter periplasmic protein LptC [Methylotenera sp.]